MKSSPSLILAAATIALLSTSVNAKAPDYSVGDIKDTYIGCFKSEGGLEETGGKNVYQSSGACRTTCAPLKTKYSGLTKKFLCYCGNELPPESDQIANSKCNLNCPGFPDDPCWYTWK